MLTYRGQWESVVEVNENGLIILFEGSSGLDNPKQCLITMTVFCSVMLYSMPTANTKSRLLGPLQGCPEADTFLAFMGGARCGQKTEMPELNTIRDKMPSWGSRWVNRERMLHTREGSSGLYPVEPPGGNLELTLLFFPASTCEVCTIYNSSLWRFFFFFPFPLQFKKRQRLCLGIFI